MQTFNIYNQESMTAQEFKNKGFNQLNDTERQALADQFVHEQPFRLENCLVEYVLSKSYEDQEAPFSYDDIENFDYSAEIEIVKSNGKTYYQEFLQNSVEYEDKIELTEHLIYRVNNLIDIVTERLEDIQDSESQEYEDLETRLERLEEKQYNLNTCLDNLNNAEFDQAPEIMQWFSVSDYTYRALNRHSQCVLDGSFWGRQAFGQSITLDRVIQLIAYEYFTDHLQAEETTQKAA